MENKSEVKFIKIQKDSDESWDQYTNDNNITYFISGYSGNKGKTLFAKELLKEVKSYNDNSPKN